MAQNSAATCTALWDYTKPETAEPLIRYCRQHHRKDNERAQNIEDDL
jgi:hypothetical protein